MSVSSSIIQAGKFFSVPSVIFLANLYGVNPNINGKIAWITPVIATPRAIKANLDGDLVEKYDKDLEAKTKELSKRFKPFGLLDKDQRARVAELAVIETNLAYAYANALKGKDRLTEKNIDDAMKSVQIFGVRSAEVVKDRIAAIEKRINSSFDAKVKSFQVAGGDNAIIINKYNYMPIVKNHLGAKDLAAQQAAARKKAEEEIAGINLK